ncbi:major strawberry allergen Fra a 1.06 [Cryptomeria japonica]|uniref:major strawberry allergen Fra a 1.06 n=1 Tax=Cryptomeria japonica TaxID=3369 RepID=UPI0025ABD96E|nr:major strawberry allergen Fra a 1.06 [Cryptomeria japonica]
MVAGSFSIEIESPVEAKRLWKAILDTHNLLPKQAPGLISGITLVQGDGGVGTIRHVNFTAANKDFSSVKEKVDLIDEANMVYCFSHVEGGLLGKKVASISYKVKFIPKVGGGSITTYTCDFDSLPGVPHDEAKIEEIKADTTGLFKQVEEYLIANPTLYC